MATELDIDVLSHDIWAAGTPYDLLDELREQAPVYRHVLPQGVNDHVSAKERTREFVWLLTRHADVREVNRDAERFSSEAMGVQLWDDPNSETAKTMISVDPPHHSRLRRLVNRGFTPRMVSRFTEHFSDVAAQIVNDAIELGEFDFVTKVAAELPLVAISELLGIPVEDRGNIFEWTNKMIGSSDPEYGVEEGDATLSAMALYAYAGELANDRRENPQDDIITKLITEVDGDALGPHEFELFVLLLSVAGSETTRNATSHGLMALLEAPDQMELLRNQTEETLDTAVDEMIRWATPVNLFRRNAVVDTEIGGTPIAAGDAVVMCYTAANRDPSVFADPYSFDVTRTPNDHVAFGGGGPHFCLGANLARLEMRIIFTELLKRTASIEATGPAQRLRSNFINGIKHLPVKVTPT